MSTKIKPGLILALDVFLHTLELTSPIETKQKIYIYPLFKLVWQQKQNLIGYT